MTRALLLALLVALTALAGCLGGDDGGGGGGGNETEPSDAPGPDDENETGGGAQVNVTASTLLVTIDDAPENVTEGAPIEISWSVETGAEGGVSAGGNNTTSANASADNDTRPLEETGVAWGYESVDDPMSTSDYANVEDAFTDVTAPGNWTHNFTLDGGNASGNDTGNGTGGGNASGNGSTVYLRAYAIENGTVYWSDEIEIAIETMEPVTITIDTSTIPQLATYDPDEITVKVGQPIVWKNDDSAAHTATASSDSPEQFDTGDIAAGEESDPIILTTPGTYTYSCDNHGQTMSDATITVEA